MDRKRIVLKRQNPQNTLEKDMEKLVKELSNMCFMNLYQIYNWKGAWFTPQGLESAITIGSSFEARDDDVFLASSMKTGTTWLKALSVCIMQQNQHILDHNSDILTMENPHFYVPTIEVIGSTTKPPPFDPYDAASGPRLLHTHLPYAVLPDSLKNSNCKIVYIARNPKDTVISMWHFFNSFYVKQDQEPFPLEKTVDSFCSGIHPYGPFFEHVVEYWKESQKRPGKVLFLRYEELKSDPIKQVSRIAEFLGRPFGDEGEAEAVVQRCSFERLKNLEVNKTGSVFDVTSNSTLFRKGEVGDSNNYLTPHMEMQIDQVCRDKLHPFDLLL